MHAGINSDKTESEGTELMAFIGREVELARISKVLSCREQQNILVYGR